MELENGEAVQAWACFVRIKACAFVCILVFARVRGSGRGMGRGSRIAASRRSRMAGDLVRVATDWSFHCMGTTTPASFSKVRTHVRFAHARRASYTHRVSRHGLLVSACHAKRAGEYNLPGHRRGFNTGHVWQTAFSSGILQEFVKSGYCMHVCCRRSAHGSRVLQHLCLPSCQT